MSSVDRLGFHVRFKTQDGMRGARIAFLREVSGPAEPDSSGRNGSASTANVKNRATPPMLIAALTAHLK